MPRKKTDLEKPPEESPATTVTSPSEGDGQQTTAVAETNGHAATDEKKKPVVSYRLSSDRTTSIEIAVWCNTVRTQAGEEFEQLSITVQRSYKTDDGWQRQDKPSWRAHDVPCLLFLLQKAHSFCLDRRTTDSSITF